MGQYTNDDVCMELTIPVDPKVGLTIKLEANQPLSIRVNPRQTINFPAYKDINGVEIKVGDTVRDWLTLKTRPPYTEYKINSLSQLDTAYVNSWGLLEVVKDE